MTEHIVSSQLRSVRTITINRPEKKNALTHGIYNSLSAAIRAADHDPTVRVICLTGADGAFTAGNDIQDFEAHPPSVSRESGPGGLFAALRDAEKPLIAAVNGLAVGIGTTLLLHCDLVYAATTARFRLPFVGIGLVPEGGSTHLLPLLLGGRRASEALLFSEWIDVQKALSWGLVNDVFDDSELLTKVQARAEQLAHQPSRLLRLTKRFMKRLPNSLDERIDEEIALIAQNVSLPEAEEAFRALKEKRTPNFEQFET